jgi:PAS domain S-box-containing protein
MGKSRTKSKPQSRARRRGQPAKPAKRTPAEASLLETSQRLKSVQFANEVATWTWDILNNKVVADPNLARLFGVSAKDAAGGPIENYLHAIHPDDREAVSAAISAAMQGPNDRFHCDYRLVRKDGTSWVSARGTVERGPDGQPRYFPGVVIDISDLHRSRQNADDLRFRLDQQDRILDITLSSISDFAYIFDREGRFVFVNHALLKLWGLPLEEAVGKNFFDLKYPDDLAARLHRQIEQVYKTSAKVIDETPYTSPTGVAGYYEYIFCPVFDREGKVELVAGSTREITERKNAEAALRESQERLRELANSLEAQVQARTRELETRTNDVLVQSEQLRELSIRLMTTQDEERRRLARELHDSAGQIVAAISMNLNQIAAKTSAEKTSEKTGENGGSGVRSLVQEAVTLTRELDQEIRTTSYLLHPPLLDELGLRAALAWYVEGLQQRSAIKIDLAIDEFDRLPRELELTIFRVVQECLSNIHRHSGSKTANIRITHNPAGFLIEARDAGQGLSPEKLTAIRTHATGVGLRGMRERVRPYAGEVRINSQESQGTAITITLPYTNAPSAS